MWWFHAELGQVLGQDVVGEARLLLVEVDGDDLEADRRTRLQLQQDVEQAIAVLATRDADHHPVALFDHVEVHDGAADLAAQALFELVVFAMLFAGGAMSHLGCRTVVGAGCDPGGVECLIHVVHHCPLSMRMATSQSSKISSFAILTATPITPGSCISGA